MHCLQSQHNHRHAIAATHQHINALSSKTTQSSTHDHIDTSTHYEHQGESIFHKKKPFPQKAFFGSGENRIFVEEEIETFPTIPTILFDLS
jgi:hypothetical protein